MAHSSKVNEQLRQAEEEGTLPEGFEADLGTAHEAADLLREASDLTTFQRRLLTAIATGPMSGQDVKREIEGVFEEAIQHGRLYPNLDTLVDRDLVERGQYDRRTNKYELTAKGEEVLLEDTRWTEMMLVEGGLA